MTNTTPTKITYKPSEKGASVSDNRGNQFAADGGYVNVTCAGKPQDVNQVKVAELVAGMVGRLNPASTGLGHQYTPPIKPQGINQLYPTAPISYQAPSPKHDAVPNLFGSLASVISAVTVELAPGQPSPLTAMCKEGQSANYIRDRH